VHFVGSIAYYFQDILVEVSNNHRFTVGKIMRQPITGIASYHLK